MSRDRFLVSLRYFHVSDNNEANQGRLAKIKPLLDILLDNFQGVLEPGERIVVDESLVPFRGRLVFRQCIPGKKHKYGIKLFKLCTPGWIHFENYYICGQKQLSDCQNK